MLPADTKKKNVEYIVDIFVFFLLFYLCPYLLSSSYIYLHENLNVIYLFMTIMCLFVSGQHNFVCLKKLSNVLICKSTVDFTNLSFLASKENKIVCKNKQTTKKRI